MLEAASLGAAPLPVPLPLLALAFAPLLLLLARAGERCRRVQLSQGYQELRKHSHYSAYPIALCVHEIVI
jgi:hypothetical protein